ncbi:DUF1786 domain-containing protein [Pseudodesulfovibrio sp.]|uniref:DUF1786 domain-containing protein n=1 Tax=Pseudodesulfovibrio sp. TaxID=2035812 RepID=UPI00262173A2|nr:DUF1786 domain-containing protein [Pseudodesulfovibrio sp.]MDD3313066.1 DUF1786 domain-containing protein [Pseudodesulfovibrio sp.]
MTTTLCLDIGSGTQDVLYHYPDREIENCPKFVLPSPALRIGKRIAALREQGRNIWLHGRNMGGGVTRFVRANQKAGLAVAATRSAAFTMADDLSALELTGIPLVEECPAGYEPVRLTDFDETWWRTLLAAADLPWPDRIAACAQDHGFHPGQSNRMGRFKLWRAFLAEGGGRPESLVYDTPPAMLTRLTDLQDEIGGGPVADTGAAAVLGALYVDEIAAHGRETGITLVNIGNSHLIAFLLYKDRIHGVYEQHTGCVDGAKLWADLAKFRCGCLSFEQVFEDKGHGCLTLGLPDGAAGFAPTYVIGPRRGMLEGYDVSFPAPGGDMMLAGCFGLLKGLGISSGR